MRPSMSQPLTADEDSWHYEELSTKGGDKNNEDTVSERRSKAVDTDTDKLAGCPLARIRCIYVVAPRILDAVGHVDKDEC